MPDDTGVFDVLVEYKNRKLSEFQQIKKQIWFKEIFEIERRNITDK